MSQPDEKIHNPMKKWQIPTTRVKPNFSQPHAQPNSTIELLRNLHENHTILQLHGEGLHLQRWNHRERAIPNIILPTVPRTSNLVIVQFSFSQRAPSVNTIVSQSEEFIVNPEKS